MNKTKKIVGIALLVLGVSILLIPVLFIFDGNRKTSKLLEDFQNEIQNESIKKKTKEKEVTGENIAKENDTSAFSDYVIGTIAIKKLEIYYPIVEGTTSNELRYGIGHMKNTADIGSAGNCVLAGHRGSRYGEFFKHLNWLEKGDEVKLTDKEGNMHRYVVEEIYITNPYDQVVKKQSEREEVTLVTCDVNGTMRMIVRCNVKKGD